MDLANLREKNLKLTKQMIKQAVTRDILIIHAQNMTEQISLNSSQLSKRIRSWYSLYCPEFSKSIKSNEKFVELIAGKSRKELLSELNLDESDSMGADISEKDLNILVKTAESLDNLHNQNQEIEKYIKNTMESVCPNLLAVAGSGIGAKLLSHAGSLKKLSEMTSSTIQLFGAEKALFRHISGRGKSPKHGIIVNHPIMEGHSEKEKGKIARVLADKISIAVKVDFFNGKFVGKKLRDDLNMRFKK
ncbi:NOP58 family protein [Candidatus Woesearchaeota archaeon]|nr:NOP58 family protein [Candidatus Woesearchaeota archaeon]MBW2978485.1 NOP58 family protein [Candidatus Woesearchaeota archaeon]